MSSRERDDVLTAEEARVREALKEIDRATDRLSHILDEILERDDRT